MRHRGFSDADWFECADVRELHVEERRLRLALLEEGAKRQVGPYHRTSYLDAFVGPRPAPGEPAVLPWYFRPTYEGFHRRWT